MIIQNLSLQKGYVDLPVDKDLNLAQEISDLKKQKNAVLLAHYYQAPEIQDLADYVGDSLGLSLEAARSNADIIVFAGVHFMGETAKILNPSRKVIIPDLMASCSLSDSCPPDAFEALVNKHPEHVVVSYINCSARVKALSDIICTSANAEKVINSIPAGKPIIFAPDKNLGAYLMKKTGRDMLLWEGACVVHEAFAIEKILELKRQHPDAKFIAHPESEESILKIAAFVGSTTGMIKFVKQDSNNSYIIATEAGILHQMQKEVPHKTLIAAPAHEDNTCACSECAFMKMNTLQKLYLCLKYEQPEILVPEDIRLKALVPLQRMFEISAS
jgi:quinolinate synthase